MNDPSKCEHDFRMVFPRHITQQVPTGEEKVLFVVCSGCGKSPIYFTQLRGLELPVVRPSGLEWPEHLVITDYEWDRGDGPSVEFRMREGA